MRWRASEGGGRRGGLLMSPTSSGRTGLTFCTTGRDVEPESGPLLPPDEAPRNPEGRPARRSYAEAVRFPHFFPQTIVFPQFSPKFLDPYGHTWTQREEGGQPQKPSSDVV